MVAVTGLMTDTLYFHFTKSFWVNFWCIGAIFWGSKNIFTSKRESLQ